MRVALFVLLASVVFAQNPVVEGMERGMRMRLMMEQERLLKQQRENLAREQQQQATQAQQREQSAQESEPSPYSQQEISDAMAKLAKVRPDYSKFANEMFRVGKRLGTLPVPAFEYLETLYVIAKYSSLSQSPHAVPPASLLPLP